MTSKIKVDNIHKTSDDSVIIKKCGSTTTVGSGAGQTVVVCGATVTLGRCGGSVALASGATQSGFGRTGTVNWKTDSIKTSTFTATNGEGYFCNTTSGGFTINLPAGSAGAIISVQDYNNTFDSNALTIAPNGSEKINGGSAGGLIALSTEGEGVTLVYIDSTVGWRSIQDSDFSTQGSTNLVATGGTITTSGDYKIHKFTSPGTFCVSQVSATAADNVVSYLVVAGGGGGGYTPGSWGGGGGGAGGFREFRGTNSGCYTVSPLNGSAPITVTATGYPITVGAGGAAGATGSGPSGPPSPAAYGCGGQGNNSVFSTVTSAGGGYGGGGQPNGPVRTNPGGSGGSGGGTSSPYSGGGSTPVGPGGSGNTPPVSPPQGSNAGSADGHGHPHPAPAHRRSASGGGGATAASSNAQGAATAGGAGATTHITGSPVVYSGGGGAGASPPCSSSGAAGGTGGGGAGGRPSAAVAGTANTGGGGGGGGTCQQNGATGGSGVVIIRYKYQ